MASLMEDLLNTLEGESVLYEQLYELSQRKTGIIVRGDIPALEKITDEEQTVVSQISHIDNKREAVTKDIADVLNKDVETLKLSNLAEMLSNQKAEHDRLVNVAEKLKTTVRNIRRINDQNRELIKTSLEMVEFDMNLVRSMKQAPQTANYGRSATSTGGMLGARGGFDAKQ